MDHFRWRRPDRQGKEHKVRFFLFCACLQWQHFSRPCIVLWAIKSLWGSHWKAVSSLLNGPLLSYFKKKRLPWRDRKRQQEKKAWEGGKKTDWAGWRTPNSGKLRHIVQAEIYEMLYMQWESNELHRRKLKKFNDKPLNFTLKKQPGTWTGARTG